MVTLVLMTIFVGPDSTANSRIEAPFGRATSTDVDYRSSPDMPDRIKSKGARRQHTRGTGKIRRVAHEPSLSHLRRPMGWTLRPGRHNSDAILDARNPSPSRSAN